MTVRDRDLALAHATMTPAEHHRECGPFCEHIEFCADCVNVFGICKRHIGHADESVTWRALPADAEQGGREP